MVSSFGTESAVLLHLVAQADRNMPVVFVDTLRMFPETIDYRDTLVRHLGFTNSQTVTPLADVLAARDANNLRWSYDPDGCCEIRKVEPLKRAKDGLDSWISGRKAFQSVTRQNLPRFEIEDGRLKINPLGDWDKTALDAYFERHQLPPPSARGAGLSVHRLRALHVEGHAGRGPARGPLARLGQGRVRHPHRLDAPRRPGRSGQPAGVLKAECSCESRRPPGLYQLVGLGLRSSKPVWCQ